MAKPRVVLIDLSSLFWAAWHVHNENGVQEARSATLAGVKRACGEGNDLVAICCDSGRSFRKDLSPEYKAQREKQPQAAYGELEKTKERLRADGWLLWEVEGFEADDVIATACAKAAGAGHFVRVCSADKDLMQLLGPYVDVLRTHTWEVWDEKKFADKFEGIDVEQFGDYLGLVGDTSDNIPGCPKVGGKTAAGLLKKYQSIHGIYYALDPANGFDPVGASAVEKSLIANKAQVELSRQLVALRYDVPINFAEIYEERKVTPLTETSDLPPSDDAEPSDATSVEAPDSTASSAAQETTQAPAASSGSTAEVALVPVEYERQLEPRSLGQAAWLAKQMFNSRLYTRFPSLEAIAAVIIRGREMGLGALTALDSFHIIEGRPCPHAYLMIARAKEHPDCEYLYCDTDTSSAESCTWITKSRRNPREQRLTYTIEQARNSGLVQPAQEKTGRDGQKYMSKANQWVVRPAEMLRKTCGVQLARAEYPSATMGLYAWEEMGGE